MRPHLKRVAEERRERRVFGAGGTSQSDLPTRAGPETLVPSVILGVIALVKTVTTGKQAKVSGNRIGMQAQPRNFACVFNNLQHKVISLSN
jgi:hypothetical protein